MANDPGPVPPRDARSISVLAHGLLGVAAIVCGWCAAAGPHLHDTGELTVAAVDLGGSHAPGQPLHALLAHALVRLPLGPIAGRVALLSGLCAIAAAALAGLLAAELAATFGVRGTRAAAWCKVVAGLGTWLALPVLRQSLRVEVYTLALALFLASALCSLRWARSGRAASLWTAAWLAGLAFAVHPPHALAAALFAACLGLPQLRRLLSSPRAWFGAIGFGLMALLVLIYLPLRARAGASMWGDPQSWSGFLRYVSGAAYLGRDERPAYLGSLADYLGYFVRITWGMPLLGSAWLLLARRDASRPIALGMALAITTAFAATCLQPLEPRNPDNVAYLGPGLALCLAAGSAGFVALHQLGTRGVRWLAVLGLGVSALPPPSFAQLPVQLRADLPAIETLSALLLDAPPRALVVATGEVAISAWMLGQSVDRVRPDAALFVPGLATSSWHWERLRAHPGLDAKPRRAPGSDGHDRYTRGAVLANIARVPVLLERALPGLPPTSIHGGYLLLDASGPARTPSYAWRAIAERSAVALARDAAAGPDGDEQEAASVVRAYLGVRSRRLLQLGHTRRALRGIALALWDLPASERAAIRAERDVPELRLPPFVDDPASLHSSRGDAERQAAAELWAVGERTRAHALLDRQSKRGDPRALLQLASLLAYDGDHAAALKLLAEVDRAAPGLSAETAAARARLTQPR